jgi:hypothetical protein
MKSVRVRWWFGGLLAYSYLMLIGDSVVAQDWLTYPGSYSHDPVTGQRATQYAEKKPAYAAQPSDYRTSGFRHFRSTIQAGESADNYYRVDRWGPPVRPYGEWLFPNRPYAVPYNQWGPPNAGGFGGGLGFGGGGFGPGLGNPSYGPSWGGPGWGGPAVGNPSPWYPYPGTGVPPWFQEYHPSVP